MQQYKLRSLPVVEKFRWLGEHGGGANLTQNIMYYLCNYMSNKKTALAANNSAARENSAAR